jgi:hypothetical protein
VTGSGIIRNPDRQFDDRCSRFASSRRSDGWSNLLHSTVDAVRHVDGTRGIHRHVGRFSKLAEAIARSGPDGADDPALEMIHVAVELELLDLTVRTE